MEHRREMNAKKIALGTIAYTIGTFSLAVIWHVLLFEARYKSFGYFEGEPSFVVGFMVGFVTILVQGMILSVLFPMVKLTGTGVARERNFHSCLGRFSGLHMYWCLSRNRRSKMWGIS